MKAIDIHIKIISGNLAAPIVNPFYSFHSGKAVARDSDIFFVAFLNEQVVGAVRFCLEESTPMLRSMMIHQDFRQKGIGHQLLEKFEEFLKTNDFRNTYCLPYAHLDKFYGTIGFQRIEEDQAPQFLQDRLAEYRQKDKVRKFMCMRRV